jgi:toxin CptA
LGAFVNGACVIGAIARLGSGEWAYAATPLGYLLGCLSVQIVFAASAAIARPGESAMFSAASVAAWPLLALMAWRFVKLFWRGDRPVALSLKVAVWSPHGATVVIGFAFLASLLLAGTWAYTDVLAELARGMFNSLPARAGLATALLLGAMLGGWSAGRWHRTPILPWRVLRCLIGGVLMAWGSLLIPGSNDGLILIGMPLLWPYAWVAFLVMCLTVACALVTQDRIFPPRS